MKFLHTMLRVSDLNDSVRFYTEVLGLQEIRRNEFQDRKYTLVFLGYGAEEKDILLELTYNWGKDDKYNVGDGFGHIAFGVSNLSVICQQAKQYGGTVTREPGVLKTSAGKNVAFITDPDNYSLELIEWM